MHDTNLPTHCLFRLQGINLVYRALPALRAIDWTVLEGEQWACLGPNGAGKTSLAGILGGQATHYSGACLRSPRLREQGIAYVCFEQAKALCERDRKLDNSEFRADASDPGTTVRAFILDAQRGDDHSRHWIERLGIEAILDRGLRYISTGEMRKTLLVAALLTRPALLILDNPLDGLDRATQTQMRGVLDELIASATTVLLLCRQVEDIPPGISHVLVLDRGTVAACGPRNQVLAQPSVRSLMSPPTAELRPLPAPMPRPYELPPPAVPLLQLRDVAVSYGDVTVLRHVDWVLPRGTHCCVSGPNGCGKTTLLSLITGDNHKGYGQDIVLFGIRRGSGESIWEIKQKYGQIDTRLHLGFARGMSALEVVVSGFFDTVGLYDECGDTQRAHATRWLESLGLLDYRAAGFDTLSFGLQRMVLLSRAMVKSPVILLLDEPTLGLDGHHRSLILRAIDHIAAHSDTQVIFVSHSAGETPRCINQHLRFTPLDGGYTAICEGVA